MAMGCILPYEVPGASGSSASIIVGGWDKAAVILDTQGRWRIQRLAELLRKRLRRANVVNASIDALVTNALRRVHVFRPESSASLAATLYRLSHYHSAHMPNEEVGLVGIDSVSAFYWVDRYEAEQQRLITSGSYESVNCLSHILFALQEFRLSHGPVIALTNWSLALNSSNVPKDRKENVEHSEPRPLYRQHLSPFPAPFENPPRQLPNAHLMPPITHHITLDPPTTIDEAGSFTDCDGNRTRAQGYRRMITGTLRSGKAPESTFRIALER